MNVLVELVRRELRTRYLGTFSGLFWAFAQPLMQLAIYGYVFLYIFSARLPADEFGSLGFLPFLAIGLWPWSAFADSCNRACTSIGDNAGLLGKVAIPRHHLVIAPVCAVFLLQTLGLIAVVAVLIIGGWIQPVWTMLLAVPLMCLLMLFALGLGLLLAAINVFVRDVAQALPQLLMLFFFLTPVLYPRSLIPEAMLPIADANPMALYIGLFRHAILGVGDPGWTGYVLALAVALASVIAGYAVFRRLSPYFEDFL